MDEPRYTKANSVLQAIWKFKKLSRLINFNVVLTDGLGMLHGGVHSPKGGTVADLTDGVICNLLMPI